MVTRYCIEQIDTGLFYLDGTWAEEPEWFDCGEATAIMRRIGPSEASPLGLRQHDFSNDE